MKNIVLFEKLILLKRKPVVSASSRMSLSAGCDMFHLVLGKLLRSSIDLIFTMTISLVLYLLAEYAFTTILNTFKNHVYTYFGM